MKQHLLLLATSVVFCDQIRSQTTELGSVNSAGVRANTLSDSASISADGRYFAFRSLANNLVAGDTNATWDIFLRDRQTRITECVSLTPGGIPGNAHSYLHAPNAVSPDGRFVVFFSDAQDLVAGDVNGWGDAFLRDRQTGTTELVSVDSSGVQGDQVSSDPAMSADGRFVAFTTRATNLVPEAANGFSQILVRDRQNGTTALVSVALGGTCGDGDSSSPSISADGRFVAFTSGASDLVAGDLNDNTDIFARDLQTGTTEIVSVASNGTQGTYWSGSPVISADGTHVAFEDASSNLFSGDTNGLVDVFIRDRSSGTTEVVSLDVNGAFGQWGSEHPAISADGRFVAFDSWSTLVPNDTNGTTGDIFLRDLQAGTIEIVSRNTANYQGNGPSRSPSLSADARFVAFDSDSSNLAPYDTVGEVIVRDRQLGVGDVSFSTLCTPLAGGTIGCPCGNPAGGSDRGCDNSSGSGGASITATGVTQLTSDGLTFTTSGQQPSTLSLLVQGDAVLPNGRVFGQGVRCVNGHLRRLYTKAAVNGSIQAPDWSLWDLPVSQLAVQRGDTLQPGQDRWYFVYYRDTTVLGGCPSGSTFNATNTGHVTWSL